LATSVKLWQLVTVGYDKFDVDYWRLKGIPLANCPGKTSADAVAECALMLLLMLVRQWHVADDNLRKGVMYLPMGAELGCLRLGLLGFGATAQALAQRAKAFGMRVFAIDVVPISEELQAAYGLDEVGTEKDIDRLVSEVDCLSVHLPLKPETRGILDSRRIALMKPTAYLINTARGPLVDEKALTLALLEGRLAGAGLDVFECEPPSPENPLLRMPNVVTTPHLGGNTFSTSLRRAAFVAENIDRLAAGKNLLSRIDYPAQSNGQPK
jgi:phosphoglycerate dehydrogenase-like enzyme